MTLPYTVTAVEAELARKRRRRRPLSWLLRLIALAILLTREIPPAPDGEPASAREQRALVVGDGDFLSNSFLANGGL